MKESAKVGLLAGTGALLLGGLGFATARRFKVEHQATAVTQQARPLPLLQERSVSPADAARFERRIVAEPGSAAAWNDLGVASMQLSNYERATDAYKKSLAIDPAQGDIWSALGEVYAHSIRSTNARMPPAARAAFDRALALNPNDVRAHFYGALEKDYNGQHDAANADWLHLLTLVPAGSGPDVAIRTAMLDSLNRNIRLLSKAAASVKQPAAVKSTASSTPTPAIAPVKPQS